MSKFSRFFLFVLVSLQIHNCWAITQKKKVTFFFAKSSYIDYLAYIQTSPDQITPVDFYNIIHPNFSAKERLLNLFEKAQLAFARKHFSQAKKLYLKITNLALLDDWTDLEREIIFLAHLRISVLTSHNETAQKWLKKAISFSPQSSLPSVFKDKTFKNLFSQMQKKLRSQIIYLPLDFINSGLIKINGYTYDIEDQREITLYPGTHRISILNNQFLYFSQIKNHSELKNWQPKLSVVLGGNCQNPTWRQTLPDSITSLGFYSPSCIVELKGEQSAIKRSPKSLSSLSYKIAPSLPRSHSLPPPSTFKNNKKRGDSNWLVWGISALVLGYAITLSPQKTRVNVKQY